MAKNINRLSRLCNSSCSFFLCDIQEVFRTVMPLFCNLLENTTKLLKAGKVFEVPLIVTEQYPEKLGKTVEDFDIAHAKIVAEKTRFSMLVPKVEEKLQEIFKGKPKDVVLFGLETHVCVEQTAMDLIAQDINVLLVADCCCSRTNQDRDLALRRLQQIGCVITTSESVIFNLLCDKNHAKFNEVRKLVAKISADMQLAKVKGGKQK